MITRVFPIYFATHPESEGRRHSSPGVSVSRVRVEVEVEIALQSKDISSDGQPLAYTRVARQTKLAALKVAVKNGTYNVSAEHIADTMLTAVLVDLLV
jgi:anti-sigma28 factor (negative regulator of flagellin synthesis)